MIGHPADAIAFAIAIARDGREIGVELRAVLCVEQRHTILRAEDQMKEVQTEGLRHGGTRLTGAENGTGRWPSIFRGAGTQPCGLGWYGMGRWPGRRASIPRRGNLPRHRYYNVAGNSRPETLDDGQISNAPTVPSIPAWAIGPGKEPQRTGGTTARSIGCRRRINVWMREPTPFTTPLC